MVRAQSPQSTPRDMRRSVHPGVEPPAAPVAAASAGPALDRFFPGALSQLPRVPLTTLPTPVQALDRLCLARGLGPIWVKRDDRSGALYGGNKPRKLEFLLGEALRRRYRKVMTFGGIGTHHGLATTIGARQAGLRTQLVLLPQPVTEHVRHCLLLDYAYGAELHYAGSVAGVAAAALGLCARGLVRGDLPWIVPTGGSSARGTVGYVNAALELAEQVRSDELPEPDFVFVPLGSGGTVAGLMLGLKLAGLRTHVVAVLVTDILPPSAQRLQRLARGSLRLLRRGNARIPEVTVTAGDVTIVRSHLGRRYGAPTEAGERASALLADLEGIQLEPTYTAKCFAALLELAAQEPYRDHTLLFWNTYSSVDPAASLPRLPDYKELPAPFHRFFCGRDS
jgi:D-cysteine desulfhydrase